MGTSLPPYSTYKQNCFSSWDDDKKCYLSPREGQAPSHPPSHPNSSIWHCRASAALRNRNLLLSHMCGTLEAWRCVPLSTSKFDANRYATWCASVLVTEKFWYLTFVLHFYFYAHVKKTLICLLRKTSNLFLFDCKPERIDHDNFKDSNFNQTVNDGVAHSNI